RKQRYKIVGEHSAVKLCHWLKKSLMEDRVCYKQKFYGIKSHRCLQMTPAVISCTHKCLFCWRPTQHTVSTIENPDSPEFIVEKSIEAQKELLSGYRGVLDRVNKEKLKEATTPNNVAISLAGEPTMYPLLSDLIDEYKKRNFTTFLVTNGTNPDVLENISLPWNLYVTIPAPNKEVYEKLCIPQIPDGWERIMETLELFPSLDTKKVTRLTLVRGYNLKKPEEYAKLIEKASPEYVEAKAYMFVGFSRLRLTIEAMPSFSEIMRFAQQLEEMTNYKIKDASEDSRVVLLVKT
ncbi:MAG: 4-demethylwyosine synthase TYW1, partial [Methanomicrobia archaeon]|nr:4-demethylwyosine synthase TYW1 [Methanomicrobia archaeon]